MMQKEELAAIGLFAEEMAATAQKLANFVHAATRAVAALEEPPVSGKRQRLVVEVLIEHAAQNENEREGMKVADIDEAMAYHDPQNTLTTLRALEKKDIVELVPGQSPQHWRLTSRYAKGRQVWTRDELIIAIQHYVDKPNSGQADLEVLKDKLDRVALRDGRPDRTIGSIKYKLGNLLAIETEGERGFPHYGSGDKEVWDEFVDDADGLGAAARAILDTVD